MAQVDESEKVEEVRRLGAELDTINTEIRSLEEMINALPAEIDEKDERTAAVNGEIPGIVVSSAKESRKVNEGTNGLEKRAGEIAQELRDGKEVSITADLVSYLEERAVTTTGVLIEDKYKRQVTENFNAVAQTLDLVDSFPLDGGNSYTVPFQITDGDADYVDEGTAYTNDEGTFDTNETGRAKITNSAVVNEEVVELPNADYLSRITNSVRKSIRKKMSNQIIAGLGGSNQLKGIYNAPTNVMPAAYKVEQSAINADTLRAIVFAYGADEDVESPATLFLNKLDLAAFAAIKADDGRPYYKITYNGTDGVIEEEGLRVPYTINSACNALSASGTAVDTKTMVYGAPTCYEMPLFAGLTIKRSDDRYIEKGQIGFFGKVIAGGVINKYKGFITVVKIAAA